MVALHKIIPFKNILLENNSIISVITIPPGQMVIRSIDAHHGAMLLGVAVSMAFSSPTPDVIVSPSWDSIHILR